jgi:nicotinamide-nucleotide amidase
VRIVAIGDELLCGHTLNTNAQVLSNALFQQGVIPVSHRVVSDDPNEIRTVLLEELSFGHDVITTGGLGPTLDDLTKKVVSDLFDRRLVQNKELLRELEERYGEGFPTLFNQSIQPEGATLLSNQVGTAPGIFLEDEKLFPHARLFVLPGPPDEMKDVFFRTVLPRYFSGKSFSRYFHILKGKEHEIDPFLRSLSAKWPQLHIGIYPSYGLVGVRFFVEDSSLAAILEEVCVAFESRFRTQLIEEATLEAAVYRILKEKKITIGTAESCTAGGFMARLATIPGSSETCVGGVICYQNSVKEKLLRVPAELIERCGPVSLEVTQKMAEGVRSLLGVDVAVAISGYLGPTGGKAPVGTVCATILFQHKVFSKEFKFCGNRSSILEKTIQLLLACLVEQLAD